MPNQPGTVTAPVPDSGLPGQIGVCTVTRDLGPGDPGNPIDPVGRPGRYQVIFTLCRPGFPLAQERQLSPADELTGDSHLAIAKPALNTDNVNIVVGVGSLKFIGKPNPRGFLARFEIECDTENLRDAEHKCVRALAPSLSHWAVRLDLPVQVYQVDTVELSTGTRRLNMRNPSLEVSLSAI